MKITVRNLQNQTFTIEFDPKKEIKELKIDVQNVCGPEYLPDKQTLIYAGKILNDNRTVESYNINEKKFIVVMLKKNYTTSKKDEEKSIMEKSTENQNQITSENVNRTSELITETTTTSNVTATTETIQSTIAQNSELNQFSGEEYERKVQNIIEMGYSRDMVEQALHASFNNTERAIEYLINGIPDNIFNVTDQITPNETVTTNRNPLEFLRNQAQFQSMRTMIRNNPDLLNAALQQIGQTNPALLQLISDNQAEFLQMLNEENTTENISTTQNDNNGSNNSGNNIPRNTPVLRITQQDHAAIERLKSLGFSEDLVLQAYFACEKNESLAANFLLESLLDEQS